MKDTLNDDGEMMFNNKNNSVGNSSIMSNRLISMLSPVNPNSNFKGNFFKEVQSKEAMSPPE